MSASIAEEADIFSSGASMRARRRSPAVSTSSTDLPSASVNNAYAVLCDPIHRAEYLLESAGGLSAPQQKQVPQELLGEVMMLREEIEEAQGAGDTATLARIRRQLDDRRDATQTKISELCGGLMSASEETKKDLRIQLNAMKYINNVLAHL